MINLLFQLLLFFQTNTKRLQPVSGLLAALLVKEEELQHLAHRSFVTYLRSIYINRDKEVFDVMKLPIEDFSASLGLPMTPKVRFLKQKTKGKKLSEESSLQEETYDKENILELPGGTPVSRNLEEDEADEGFLLTKETSHDGQGKSTDMADIVYVTFFLLLLWNCNI